MKSALSQNEIEKDIFEVKIDFENLTLDKTEIIHSLGYQLDQIPDHFSELIDEVIQQLPGLVEFNAGYCLYNLEKADGRNDGYKVGGNFLSLHKIVFSQLKHSEKAALLLCTIGPKMESWSKKVLLDGDPTMAYFIDITASVVTECAVNVLHDHIAMKMEESGMKITNRYSPGYCNWHVSEQQILFSMFPKNFCGVTLTDSSLMIPIKSVSGIIGVGKNVEWKEYICDKCGVKDCTYRSNRSTLFVKNI